MKAMSLILQAFLNVSMNKQMKSFLNCITFLADQSTHSLGDFNNYSIH